MTDTAADFGIGTRRADDEVLADIAEKGLAAAIREETWTAHGRAEFSEFEQALVAGTLKVEAYADLMAQTYFVYKALEETAGALGDDSVAGAFVLPELYRLPALEADLEFYLGADWAEQIKMLPVTERYVARIHELAAGDTHQWVSHHYTRYLADLSGGFMIDKGVTRAYKLETDGRRFYIFDQIEDPKAFKDDYRNRLDNMPLDSTQQLAVIDEALEAYLLNIEMITELTERNAPIHADIEIVTD